jgi:hypothetical protein
MYLHILTISVMIAITREWLANPMIATEITKHPLGAGIWKEIARIHKLVSEFRQHRMSAETALAKLTEIITALDLTHDTKARALYTLLLGLAEATNDQTLARKLRELNALLFPQQLRINQMSYLDEAGAVVELEQRVTPEVTLILESIRVGEQTLADVYREWIAAGHELGSKAQERACIEASLMANGSTAPQTQVRQVRTAWVRGVRLLLDTLDMLELSTTTRESLLAPLRKAIHSAMLRRSQGGTVPESGTEPDMEPGMELDMMEPDMELNMMAPDIELALRGEPEPTPGLRSEPDIKLVAATPATTPAPDEMA